MTHPEAPSFDVPREDLLRAAAALRAVVTALRAVRERQGRAAFSDPENAARKAAVGARNALLPFDTDTTIEWNDADRTGLIRGAAHPDTGMTVRVAELSRGRYGVQAGWVGNHVETVVGDQHLAEQLAKWLMADPTADRLDELGNALDPTVRRPASDRAAAAHAWGMRHDPLWLAHWRTPEDLVRAWRQATGRDPRFNADLATARASAAAADPDWYMQWWHRHGDSATPGARHLTELDIIRRYGPNARPADPDATASEATDRQQAGTESSTTPRDGASVDDQPPTEPVDSDFEQARQWANANDSTWFDTWSDHYAWASTRDGRRALEHELLSRWRRRDTNDPASTVFDGDGVRDAERTPMTERQRAVLAKAGRRHGPSGLTWVEASLLIDEVHGTPRGEKAGEWLRANGVSGEAADRAVAAAAAKLFPDQSRTSSPTADQPTAPDAVHQWFRDNDPDYFQPWNAAQATARDQDLGNRELRKLWNRLTGHDSAFNTDLATARFQIANNDPEATRRWQDARDAASPSARDEIDRELIDQWHPAHSFRPDNYFHTEPAPSLAQLLRGRVPDHVLDHPRWPTAEDTFTSLVDRGAMPDSLADAVAAVDFNSGNIRAPSGYASWVMRETAKATVPEPGSDNDRRRLVAEWLTSADPTNPVNRSVAAQLVGEFDERLDADIARAYPGILDGDSHHPDATPFDETDHAYNAASGFEPSFRTADHANTEAASAPTNTDIVDDDTLTRAAAPLTPPTTPPPATATTGERPKRRTPGQPKTRKAQPNQRRTP